MPSRADSPTRTCTEPDCARAMRARGLCSTHYNRRHQPNRHATSEQACTVCGTPVTRPSSSLRRPVCSIGCRRIVQFGPGPAAAPGYDWAQDAVKRAREAGATVIEPFDRLTIFERDNWVCYLCSQPTDPDASPFCPSFPTVDHVVPLSQGGAHNRANARTACLHCNSSKQDALLPGCDRTATRKGA